MCPVLLTHLISTILDTAHTNLSASICQGDSYSLNGVPLTTDGIHRDTLTNVNGCDSILILDLIVTPDMLSPAINCLSTFTLNLGINQSATLNAAQIDNGTTDNCGDVNLSLNKTSFTCADIGMQTVILTAEDNSGNQATCAITITITDTEANCDCQDGDLVINDRPIPNGMYVYKGAITSAGSVPLNGAVVFSAGTVITLLPNFEAKANFTAQIGDCSANTIVEKLPEISKLTIPSTNIFLEQNRPNPFNQNTIIGYAIPENTKKAAIRIVSHFGQLITVIPLTQIGKGQVEIEGQSYAPGIYYYSLLLDGKVQETKKMVLTR